ncbi:hypothetical protein ACI3PL_29735, partial [Lacticaseibacillus paracasei]
NGANKISLLSLLSPSNIADIEKNSPVSQTNTIKKDNDSDKSNVNSVGTFGALGPAVSHSIGNTNEELSLSGTMKLNSKIS